MKIDEKFLIENNITQEEYEKYYYSIEIPKIEKSVNEYGAITLIAGNFGFEFNPKYMPEDEAIEKFKEEYFENETKSHFISKTMEIKENEEKEKNEKKSLILSEKDEAIFNTNMNVEYLVIMQELGM